MDFNIANENWTNLEMLNDLDKFADELNLDSDNSSDGAFNISPEDLLIFLNEENSFDLPERTPTHQPISSVSQTADLSPKSETQEYSSYGCSDDSEQQSSNTLAIANQTNMEFDDIVISDSTLAEYFKAALSSPDGQTDSKTMFQCSNCSEKFNEIAFNDHICDYDENHNLIADELTVPSEPEDSPADHPCIKQLDDNNVIIRNLLKGFYKSTDKIGTASTTGGKKIGGPHNCSVCDRKFVHATGLARHMKRHEQDDEANKPETDTPQAPNAALIVVKKCQICFRIFNRVGDALHHIKEAHSMPRDLDELDMSEDDDEYFKDTISIAEEPQTNPLQVLVQTSVLQCEFCEYNFSNMDALLLHEATHNPRRGYECTLCEIHVPTVKEILSHRNAECPFERYDQDRKTNASTYFVCNVCETKFKTLAELYDHRYSMFHLFPRNDSDLEKGLVGCEICGEIFDTAKGVIDHRTEHQPKKLTRKQQPAPMVVDKETGEKSLKLRQYLCDVCGKSYTQSSHLWQHLRFHKGVKPFACTEPNCLRRFTIRPDLNDHIRKCHTGERPYHCLICGKRFLTGSVFYQHRLIHRGERRYGCDDCGKRFYRADALKNHQRIHSGEKPFACTHCPKTFRQRGDRDKHIRARHSGPVSVNRVNDIRSRKVTALPPDGRIRSKKDLLLRGPPPSIKRVVPPGKPLDVVYVGNVAFPTSMFVPLVSDIDA